MNKQSVLITGGAGYIGSHAILAFRNAGHKVAVVDNLTTGVRRAVPTDVPFYEGNAGDIGLISSIVADQKIDAVIHFAGSIVVPESVENPLKYYENNSAVSRNLIAACVQNKVRNFIFSSTAAVYGIPETSPVTEDTPTRPINPYGSSKLMTETMLRDSAAAYDFRFTALRYFNVAGADPRGRTGQCTPQATHLIKVASELATGKRPSMQVFGDDYNTPDGTCVRDYIHVSDLADAHVLALKALVETGQNRILNCGYGHGFSVRQVLDVVQKIAGRPLQIIQAGRRAGDPDALVSDPSRLRAAFGWQPKHDDIEFIVRSAMDWESKLGA